MDYDIVQRKSRTFETDCPLDAAMSLIEGKWKPMILCRLMMSGGLRFNELQRGMPMVSPRILTKQLRELEECGMISREVSGDSVVRVTYTVTPLGMTLAPVLKDLAQWAVRNLSPGLIVIDGIADGKVTD